MKISNHAKARMAERNITDSQVLETLSPPNIITSGRGERLVATKNGIRVVYAINNQEITVVTVTHT